VTPLRTLAGGQQLDDAEIAAGEPRGRYVDVAGPEPQWLAEQR
jgi:hypothetical protein